MTAEPSSPPLRLVLLAVAGIIAASIIIVAIAAPGIGPCAPSPDAEYVTITTQDNETYAAPLTPSGEVPPRKCWMVEP